MDELLGYQTLDANQHQRQSTLETGRNTPSGNHCEDTPGFKRGTPTMTPDGASNMMEDSVCRESMQSSTFTVGQPDYYSNGGGNNGLQSTMRKSDQYKRKSSTSAAS